MRLLNERYVSQLPKKGILVPLIFASLWISGFYLPEVSEYFYSTRWEVSLAIGLFTFLYMITKKSVKSHFLSLILLVLIAILLLSMGYSFVPKYTFFRTFSAILLVFSSYFLAISLIETKDDIKRVFYAFLFLYLVLITIFFYSIATDPFAWVSNRLQANEHFKATGGGNMIVSAVLLLFWYFKFCPKIIKNYVLLLILVLVIAVFLTRSRVPIAGALLLWPIGWGIIRGRKFDRAFRFMILVFVILGALLFISPHLAEKLRINKGVIEASGYDITTGRMDRWKVLVETGNEKPIFGHGFGTSRYIKWYQDKQDSSVLEWDLSLNTTETQVVAHSQHVQMYFEVGILGLIAFWIVLIKIMKRGMNTLYLMNTPITLMMKMMFLSICFHLIDSFSHDGLLSTGNPVSYLFWFKVGFLIQSYFILKREDQP